MTRLLERLFDEAEFLSPYGIRSLSAAHRDGLTIDVAGMSMSIATTRGSPTPACSAATRTGAVRSGSRSTCCSSMRCTRTRRGRRPGSTVEFPTGSGERLGLHDVAQRLEDRSSACSGRARTGAAPATRRDLLPGRCGPRTPPSASTSTATPARASGPRTRPAGPRWSPTSSARPSRPTTRGSHPATAEPLGR